TFLIDNPDLAAVIEEAIFSKWAPQPDEEVPKSTAKAKAVPDEKAEKPTEPSPEKAQTAASGKA
ncbi:MAG: hypothetical protein QF615_04360, partial [Planctomycetota bacterium]|nr:hypothetical protein [Planctomycetota bacterium]